MNAYTKAEQDIKNWRKACAKNAYSRNQELQRILQHHLGAQLAEIEPGLMDFGEQVAAELPAVVYDNHQNLPVLEDAVVTHASSYERIGDAIYGTGLMAMTNEPGRLTEAMAFFYLSCHLGEAGHNCPIACNAGMLRVLSKNPQLPGSAAVIAKMLAPSYRENWTAAQFVTEIQGGSDVGQNACVATLADDGSWRISGEKWFCSNCHADVILMTARFDDDLAGTRGLGLFFVPARLSDQEANHLHIRKLKDKLGTRTLATGEIEFNGAVAYQLEPLESSFKILMTDVLHISRLFNAVCVAGMAQRALTVASEYAEHRVAFGQSLNQFANVQAELLFMQKRQSGLNANVFHVAALQDKFDLGEFNDDVLLRVLVNMNKSFTAKCAVAQVRNCIDMLAGNGMVMDFSELPRFMCDALVCENWEGTHHILEAQILSDVLKHNADERVLKYLSGLGADVTELSSLFSQLKSAPPEQQVCMMAKVVKLIGEKLARHSMP